MFYIGYVDIDVNIKDQDEVISISIEINDDFASLSRGEKRSFLKDEVTKQMNKKDYEDKKFSIVKGSITDAIEQADEMIDEISDTSSMHPNETLEEFMEHEDFE